MYCTKTQVDWQAITVTAQCSASVSRVKQSKTLNMEALRSSEMSALIYQPTWSDVSKDLNLHQKRCANLESRFHIYNLHSCI